MVATIDQRLDIADVVGSEADEGEIRVNLGEASEGVGLSYDSPFWGLDGFISRPNDPDDDGATLAMYIADGNEKYVIASKDNRFADKVGTMDPGDRAIITNGEARFFLKRGDDAVMLYTVNSSTNQAMMVHLDGSSGLMQFINSQAFIKIDKDKITLGVNGGGMLTIDSNGVQVDGAYFRAACKGGHLGVLGPQPNPIQPMPPAQSIIFGPTGMAGVGSTSWTVTP